MHLGKSRRSVHFACPWDKRNSLTSDVVEHPEIEQRIGETKQGASNDGRPVAGIAITGEREPKQGNRESPDADQARQKSGFGTALASIAFTVARVEPSLHWQEAKHDGDTDDEVEVGQVCADVAQSVVVDKDIEDAGGRSGKDADERRR